MSGDTRATLITGGSSGIGAATARLLLSRGERVAVTGRDEARLKNFAEEAGAGDDALLCVAGDATDAAAVGAAVEAATTAFGRLDAVVASAGFNTFDGLAEGDPDGWRDMILVNVLAPALLVQAALPALRRSQGRIVLLGSEAGVMNRAGSMYSVSKWGLTAFAENTRLLVAEDGIGVTMVAPGPVDTPFFATKPGGTPGSHLTAGDLASTIVWALDQPPGVEVNTVVLRPARRTTG